MKTVATMLADITKTLVPLLAKEGCPNQHHKANNVMHSDGNSAATHSRR